MKCTVCNQNEALGVAASPFLPASFAYCHTCLMKPAEPESVFIYLIEEVFDEDTTIIYNSVASLYYTYKDGKYIKFEDWAKEFLSITEGKDGEVTIESNSPLQKEKEMRTNRDEFDNALDDFLNTANDMLTDAAKERDELTAITTPLTANQQNRLDHDLNPFINTLVAAINALNAIPEATDEWDEDEEEKTVEASEAEASEAAAKEDSDKTGITGGSD